MSRDAPALRVWSWAALAAYSVFLAYILLNPSPSDSISVVDRVLMLAEDLGVSGELVTGRRVEFVLNALLFAPIPFLGIWAMPRIRGSGWVTLIFVGSLAVEVVQGTLLPDRSAEFADVVANTLGGVLGAVLAVGVQRRGSIPGFGSRLRG